MTKTELSKIRVILESRYADLVGFLLHREDITGVACADQIDQIQSATEREMAIGNLERDSSRLAEVREALRRIQQGTFCICSECDEEISARRLAAIPWTSSCLACTEAADAMTPRFGTAGDISLLRAA